MNQSVIIIQVGHQLVAEHQAVECKENAQMDQLPIENKYAEIVLNFKSQIVKLIVPAVEISIPVQHH